MIPWLVSQQFQDEEFAGLSGARVVRIATNPDYVGMGYGKRALDLLTDFYEGKFASLEEASTYIEDEIVRVTDEEIENSQLQTDTVKVRDAKSLPPLLLRLSEKRPEPLDYLGVSYGLTDQLHKFWKKSGFVPVYLRQTAAELTGEYSCVMIKTLADKDSAWLGAFATDFRKRFLELLSYEFRKFNYMTPLLVLESANAGAKLAETSPVQLTKFQLDQLLSPFDLKRLESYADNMLDYHVILDMVPLIANLHFTGRLKNLVSISPIQSAVLMAIGLQRKTLDGLEKELGVGNAQVLSMFQKVMRKVATAFRELLSKSIEETLPKDARGKSGEVDVDGNGEREFAPVEGELRDELEEAGEEAVEKLRLKELQRDMVNELDLSK